MGCLYHTQIPGVEHLDAVAENAVVFQHRPTVLQTGWNQAPAVGMNPAIPENTPEKCLQIAAFKVTLFSKRIRVEITRTWHEPLESGVWFRSLAN